MGCSLLGSSVRGIFQARILEWVAIFFSRGIFPTQGSNPGLLQQQVASLCAELQPLEMKSLQRPRPAEMEAENAESMRG